MQKYEKLYTTLGHKFNNEKLLEEALTHPSLSYTQKKKFNYERLEFLGDAILAYIIIEYLFKKYPNEEEGSLSKRKAALVCTDCLAYIANKLELGKYLILSKGEEKDNGRTNKNNLENALEATIGALYLDGGMTKAKTFILKYWQAFSDSFKEAPKDVKTQIQEWTQKTRKALPEYKFLKREGLEHKPIFYVELKIKGLPSIKESGNSKKEAQKEAAKKMLEYIKRNVDKDI